MSKRIVVLASGGGSNLQSLIDAGKANKFDGAVVAVISDTANAYALARARHAGIEAIELNKKSFADRADFDQALLDRLIELEPDLIVLAGYLSIVPKSVVARFAGRIINIHPSLIPKFCGMGYYGAKVHEAVILAGEKESGATVHYVDEGVDTGAIIIQEKVSVIDSDTAHTLSMRVLEVEHRIIVEAVTKICGGKEN